MNIMNLGDLEFKAEDFAQGVVCDCEACSMNGSLLAEHANRLLRERLAKAPEVRSFKGFKETVWHPHPVGGDTHSARLVCIEEVKK